MKRAKWYLMLLSVSMLLFVGGACGPPEPPIPPTLPEPPLYSSISIPIEEFPNHPHIDAVMSALVGQELTVTLGSNLTTGFRWSELAEISDETIIQQVSHEYVGKEYETPPLQELLVKKYGLSRLLRMVLLLCLWNTAVLG